VRRSTLDGVIPVIDVTRVTRELCRGTQVLPRIHETIRSNDSFSEVLGVGVLVSRALRNHNVWLVLGYVGLMLLMARAYA
jgi:hypothetical protein